MESFWSEIARAVCLVFIIEGMVPFLWPNRWRNMLETVSHTDDRTMRIVGFVSMLIGVVLLYLL